MTPPAAGGPAPAGPATLRRHNLGLVLGVLRAEGGASRARLAAATGLTRATVAGLVEPLLSTGVLVEDAAVARGVGRPARAVRFHPRGPAALGVAIDVDSVAACVVGLDGAVRARVRTAREHRDLSPAAVFGGAAEAVADLPDTAGPATLGVGLAVPALLGRGPGGDADPVVLRAPNLPRLVGTRPAGALAALLGRPVTVGNEATLGALAHLDVAPDFVYTSGGIGVGGGVVLDGRVHRGVHGVAGELGHVVVDRDGPPCGCGGRGCVEQYAGTRALLAGAGVGDLDALAAALTGGDPRATAAAERAGAALGVGLASVLNVLDVPVVVLGGAHARLAPALLPALRVQLDARTLQPGPARVLVSDRGEDAAVRGAAQAVLVAAASEPQRLGEPDRARVRTG